MENYLNSSGKSGVVAYALGAGSIIVQFADGATYLYTNESAGADVIVEMQTLAKAGLGLSTFISRSVGRSYLRKWQEAVG